MGGVRRFSLMNVPQLTRRAWEDVAPELERFLQKMWDSETDGIPAGFLGTLPETTDAGDPGTPGTETAGWAAADHDHPVLTGAGTNLANANAEGTSAALARADHKHKRDVRVKLGGVDVGTRNALDFRDSVSIDFAPVDDAGNDEVDIVANLLPWYEVTAIDNGDSPYTVLATDFVILVDASAGDTTVSLPAASAKEGRWLEVKKVDNTVNKVIIDAAGADLIDGDATAELLYEDEAVPIVSDGVSEWSVL